MSTFEKIQNYRQRLEVYKNAQASNDPWRAGEEPKPEDYGLRSTAEKWAAAKTREEILGK